MDINYARIRRLKWVHSIELFCIGKFKSMSDFEKELELMSQQISEEPEVALPSIDEQKKIAAELKRLEAAGELTPEVLEQYFGQFYAKSDAPVH